MNVYEKNAFFYVSGEEKISHNFHHSKDLQKFQKGRK